jgi:serine/threonine protein kinase
MHRAANRVNHTSGTRNRTSDSRSSSRTGTGRFKKGRKIGAGGFGSVYLCTSTESGNQYVLKEVSLRGLSASDQTAAVREV